MKDLFLLISINFYFLLLPFSIHVNEKSTDIPIYMVKIDKVN